MMNRTLPYVVFVLLLTSCCLLHAADPLLNALRHSDVSSYELTVAGGGDARKAPEGLVAVLGSSRLAHYWRPLEVAFTADGKLLASVSDNTVRLWDPTTGEERQRFEGRSAPGNVNQMLHCMAFSADGRRVAAAGYNNAILVWGRSALSKDRSPAARRARARSVCPANVRSWPSSRFRRVISGRRCP